VRANAAQRGGGLFLGFSEAALTNDVFADNQAVEGSGLYLLGSSARLQHTTVARNGDGSGLHVAQSFYGDPSRAWLTNTIVASHTLGITVTAGCTVTLEGTLWGAGAWANAAKWDGAGTILAGTLQVDGDPAFVDPDAGDYHVGLASAAVDRGLDAGVETDLDGDPRPLGQGHDLGADEVGLILVKRASPDPVPAGTSLSYTLRLTNASDVDLHATLTDTLPLPLAPGQTALVPGGQITWTAHVTAPRGGWTRTFAITVAEDYAGPLTNIVRASAQEGASAVYTATSTVFVPQRVYLPFVSRDAQGMTTVVGEYLLVGNPCTTDPCLPGMVYAVGAEGRHYYLTVEGAWLWSNRSWEDYTPQVGDWVTASGYVDEALDTFGLSFYDIKVLSLEPALSPPTVTGNVVISGVHSHPSYDQYVEIRNDGDQAVDLGGWRLHDASGQHTFTFPEHLMPPGQVCRVYTREDHPEWCGFRLGSETTVWNYAQGCAYLRDSAGALADAHCYCQSHSAHMTISATASTLLLSEAVTVTTTLFNYGCLTLGLPQYRLYVQSDAPEPVFDPEVPGPVAHSLGIGPGESDAAEFVLQAVGSGQARLSASSSFEVHLGYPGPAYWGAGSTGPMTVTVRSAPPPQEGEQTSPPWGGLRGG
jgi:hypothetical protein